MNRPIKFRAWDFTTGVMHERGFFVRGSDGQVLDLQGAPRPWTALQFTGLLDAKGREIYEGDVVMKMGQFTTPKRNLYEVVFEDGAFVGSSVVDYEVMGKGKKHLTLYPLNDEFEQFPCEVIGNAFENPDLLSV